MNKFFYICFLGVFTLACQQVETDHLNADTTPTDEPIEGTIKTGLIEELHENGRLKISGVLDNDGLKKGVWTSYFENGQKNSESNFLKGINNGYSMVWYPNGNVRYFGDYKDGKRIGEWVFYEEDGTVAKKESYH